MIAEMNEDTQLQSNDNIIKGTIASYELICIQLLYRVHIINHPRIEEISPYTTEIMRLDRH